MAIEYPRDRSIYGRVAALEEKVRRLESGGVLVGASVLVQLATTLTGAWPQSASFNVNNPNSKIVILWDATAFITAQGNCTVALNVDGTQRDSDTLAANNSISVRLGPLTGLVVVTGLAVGSHTAQLAVTAGTTSVTDVGHLLVLELPQ